MSLINQMLQELEQRKASPDTSTGFKPMAHPLQAVAAPRKNKILQYAVLSALCIGGVYGMQLVYQRGWINHSSLPAASGVIAEANAQIKPSAAIATAPVPKANDEVPVEVTTPLNFAPTLERNLHISEHTGALAPANSAFSNANPVATHIKLADNGIKRVQDIAPSTSAPATASAVGTQLALANVVPAPKPAGEAKVVVNKSMTTEQKSAHLYQQAINYLQQGRVAEALDQLMQVLDLTPQHDDARQTLVGLLVDNKRLEQAVQVLKTGLQLNPQHAGYAQTLARLQLETGAPEEALHTLESQANLQQADTYYALMAVVLQKTGQHAQAIDRYQQALSQGAGNPVWWIGMGVSLQAEGRLPEAKRAYQQALSGQLTPELTAFASLRLKQVQ